MAPRPASGDLISRAAGWSCSPQFSSSVIQLPGSATFLTLFHDSGFLAVTVIALTAGVERGFSGFGAALIYVPLTAVVFAPPLAVACFMLIDFTCVVPYAVRAFRECHWREVLAAFAAGFVLVPLGTLAQAPIAALASLLVFDSVLH